MTLSIKLFSGIYGKYQAKGSLGLRAKAPTFFLVLCPGYAWLLYYARNFTVCTVYPSVECNLFLCRDRNSRMHYKTMPLIKGVSRIK